MGLKYDKRVSPGCTPLFAAATSDRLFWTCVFHLGPA